MKNMMYCKCDGCNKEEKAVNKDANYWIKPHGWLEVHTQDEGVLTACSKDCVWHINAMRVNNGQKQILIAP